LPRGIKLLEDCAQAHGARWQGQPVGSFGDAAAFSFCTDKIMSMGEGGMVLCRNESVWHRAWSYKDHGKDWNAVYDREHPPGFRWLHESFGSNWRLTEVQSSIGRRQLQKLPEWLKLRARNAARLAEACGEFSALRVPWPPEHVNHAWYKFHAFVRPEALRAGWDRDRIVSEINALGVPCQQGICPEVYLEKAFDGTGFRPEKRLPVARELGETSLMFPVHPTLTEKDLDLACDAIRGVMRRAAR
jgi:dTDP-4-amino-4,6-dideoxygalactose transaminase